MEPVEPKYVLGRTLRLARGDDVRGDLVKVPRDPEETRRWLQEVLPVNRYEDHLPGKRALVRE